MRLSRNLWPGKGAWISGEPGSESRYSRRQRRAAREQAIYRKQHPGPVRRALASLGRHLRRLH